MVSDVVTGVRLVKLVRLVRLVRLVNCVGAVVVTDDDVCAEILLELDEVNVVIVVVSTFVLVFVSEFVGSSAMAKTLLQLIGFSSSPYPESVSGSPVPGNGVARPLLQSRNG